MGMSSVGAGTNSTERASLYVPFDAEDCTVHLHEFGHALGLNHEFENPDSLRYMTVNDQLYKTLQDYLGWNRKTADATLIKKKVPPENRKPFDPNSVMGYQQIVLGDIYGGRVEMNPGTSLSEGDKAYIAVLFPGKQSTAPIPPIVFPESEGAKVEPSKIYAWSEHNLTFDMPVSFDEKSRSGSQLVFSNRDASTSAKIFSGGATGDYDAMAIAAKKVRATPTGGTLTGHREFLSSGGGGGKYYLYDVTYEAMEAGKKGADHRYHIRIAEIHFSNGKKFRGEFVYRSDDVLKEQIDALLSSARVAGEK